MTAQCISALKIERILVAAKGAWIRGADLARSVGITPGAVPKVLQPAVRRKLVERSAPVDRENVQSVSWRATELAYAAPARRFTLKDWPPGFVSQWDDIVARERAAVRD
jgi:hypothetical protein